MAGHDLGDLGRIIERLERRGRLIRVNSEVDGPDLRVEAFSRLAHRRMTAAA
jgi:hypothetical protein